MLRALEETENALVAYREEQAAAGRARSSRRARAPAPPRSRASATAKGVADFLALLDAERTQLQAEDAVAQAEAGVFTGVVARLQGVRRHRAVAGEPKVGTGVMVSSAC